MIFKQIKVALFFIVVSSSIVHASVGGSLTCSHKDYEANTMADIVIFSRNRPMQLEAYLESLKIYVTGLRETFVIYRADDNDYDRAYQVVKKKFPDVKFYRQQNPPHDFKPLLLDILFNISLCKCFLFGVDDIIMTDFVNLSDCITIMNKESAYGCYLRLGKNITRNYTLRKSRGKDYPLPPLKEVTPGFFSWRFDQASHPDWRACNSFDMTLWRKQDVMQAFYTLNYKTPNVFESQFYTRSDYTKKGICYARSKMVNLPLNIVQERKKGIKSMNYSQPKELLLLFNTGMRMNIKPFFQINNNAGHMEYVPEFISIK